MSKYLEGSIFVQSAVVTLQARGAFLQEICAVNVCVCSLWFLTFSSVETVSLSLEMRLHTCCRDRPRNSSPCTTSVKCCSGRHKVEHFSGLHAHASGDDSQIAVCMARGLPAKAWAWLRSCVHVCRSAKALMPKQLVGWSWDWRNSQQTCRTSISWRRLAAGSRTWDYNTHTHRFIHILYFLGSNIPTGFKITS